MILIKAFELMVNHKTYELCRLDPKLFQQKGKSPLKKMVENLDELPTHVFDPAHSLGSGETPLYKYQADLLRGQAAITFSSCLSSLQFNQLVDPNWILMNNYWVYSKSK